MVHAFRRHMNVGHLAICHDPSGILINENGSQLKYFSSYFRRFRYCWLRTYLMCWHSNRKFMLQIKEIRTKSSNGRLFCWIVCFACKLFISESRSIELQLVQNDFFKQCEIEFIFSDSAFKNIFTVHHKYWRETFLLVHQNMLTFFLSTILRQKYISRSYFRIRSAVNHCYFHKFRKRIHNYRQTLD